MRSTPRTALVAAALLVFTGCGVPTDESAQPIAPDELPESLRPDFTTTSTTSTIAAPGTEQATVYMLLSPPDTERRLVVAVQREVPNTATLQNVLTTVFEVRASDEEQADGYVNSLFELRLIGARVENEIATIDMVPLDPVTNEPSEEAFTGDLIGAAAQLVFSATEHPGVTGVRILIDGEPVPIPTNDADAEGGAVLDRDDYEQFNPNTPVVIPTTTTTTVPGLSSTTTEATGS